MATGAIVTAVIMVLVFAVGLIWCFRLTSERTVFIGWLITLASTGGKL